LLEFTAWPEIGSEESSLVQRLQATVKVLNLTSLRTASMVLEALASNQTNGEKESD
jgi:hypothetical protein